MKIVFLSRYQNKVERGVENFVKELSVRLSQKHQVDILTGKEADSLDKILTSDYDVVIPVNGRLQSLKASLGRFTGKYKLLISGHSGIGRDDIWNIAIVRPDVFVALTEKMAVWANQWAWGTKIVKISNGIDLEKFSPTGETIEFNLPKPIILSVGALVWYIHHASVIRAVGKLGFGSVLIVGEGEGKETLLSLGKKILGEKFKITSFKYEEMPKVYRSADLFTLPSWDREAFGLVYLEALASGLGVIAPDDSSRREIIGNGGILVDAENLDKYQQAIAEGLTINWQKKARQQAEKFSWDNVAKRYEQVLENLRY